MVVYAYTLIMGLAVPCYHVDLGTAGWLLDGVTPHINLSK